MKVCAQLAFTAGIPLLAFCVAAKAQNVSAAQSHGAPMTRTFQPSSTESYRIDVTINSDVRGVSTEKIGERTYVKPFERKAQVSWQWSARRSIGSVAKDGSAVIDEIVSAAGSHCSEEPSADSEAAKLQRALQEMCDRSKDGFQLRYHEQPDGEIADLGTTGVPSVKEAAPPLLTLWLRRAIRPSVIFPAEPFVAGSRKQQSIAPSSSAMNGATGSTLTEWMNAENDPPAAKLHVVQDLSWNALSSASSANGAARAPDARVSFFADSLTTVSLLDGSVQTATRSASRETKRILDPVVGLPEPPVFAFKLTVTVTIDRLP